MQTEPQLAFHTKSVFPPRPMPGQTEATKGAASAALSPHPHDTTTPKEPPVPTEGGEQESDNMTLDELRELIILLNIIKHIMCTP